MDRKEMALHLEEHLRNVNVYFDRERELSIPEPSFRWARIGHVRRQTYRRAAARRTLQKSGVVGRDRQSG
jgi:hypothetical protein